MGHNDSAVSGMALVFLALALLLLPLRWIGAVLLAMAVHEGSHYLAARLCGVRIRRIDIGMNGARMEIEALDNWQELLCALAGPAGGLLLLFAAKWMPRTAVCGAFQSLFNLLPVYPLDGGRVLRCVSDLLLSPLWGNRVCKLAEALCMAGILCLGFYGTFCLRLGLMPIGIAVMLLQRSFGRKIPCKPERFSLQYRKP